MDDKKLADILLQENYVTQEDLSRALLFTTTHRGSLRQFLLEENIITKDLLGQAIAESFGVPYADISARPPSRDEIAQIPEALARRRRVMFFSASNENVVLATDAPQEPLLADEVRHLFPGRTVVFAYALPEDIDQLFVHYHKSLETRFVDIIKKLKRIAPEILQEILNDAVAFRASDVHFEPQEKEVLVRFRIDGVLHEAGRFAKEYYENILNRIKIQGRMRIDEHRSAQDGAIRTISTGGPVDIRVSIIPTVDGEKIAIRLLSQYVQGFVLPDLGLGEKDHERLLRAADKPFGMILVTGPTGSGKTTTLYALLKVLNSPEVNITTIEDPVEYKVSGINQIQVDSQTNLTFVQGLRSIVRQDPDVILVGEIRDNETAEIAVNAALTGHLLLSTFHANDAATAAVRLLDMKVEPFLLASTLELVIGQRLLRRICESCRFSYREKPSVIESLAPQAVALLPKENPTLYKGKGCEACGGTGYKGRVAAFEMIEITPTLQDLMLKNPSTKQIWKCARGEGAISLFEDGMEKVKSGITTLEEVLRVAPPSRE